MWTSETVQVLRTLVLGLAAVSLGALAWRCSVVPPLRPARLGERGRRRTEWLAQGGFAPLGDAWVRRLAAFVPAASWQHAIERRLILAGEPWGFGPRELVAASACSAAAGWLMAFWLHGTISLPFVLGLAVVAPWLPALRVREVRRARLTAVERSLPMAMDLVALCVRAGSDFPAALRFVVRELETAHRVCTHELSRIEEAIALGRTRVDALKAFAERLDSAPVSRFVAALVQSERRGIPLAEALATQAESLRRLRSVRAEESAAKAGVRMVAPLMLMLAAILTLLLGPLVLQGVAL